MNQLTFHPTGEARSTALTAVPGPVAVDTFGGRIHVEWDAEAAVTPLGQLPFFIDFLQVSGRFEPWVASCPLTADQSQCPQQPRYPGHRRVGHSRGPSALCAHQRPAR